MVLDWNKYVETARQVSAEGCVLLKNEAHTLPLQEGCRVAVFGRIQNNYYKSGTGSGGMVNVSNVTGILDALREEPGLSVDETVRETYEKWEKETRLMKESAGQMSRGRRWRCRWKKSLSATHHFETTWPW